MLSDENRIPDERINYPRILTFNTTHLQSTRDSRCEILEFPRFHRIMEFRRTE